MSFWVEVHCDVDRFSRSGQDRDNILLAICHSDRHDNQMIGLALTADSAARAAVSTARRFGWMVDRYGRWTCPGCAKHGLAAGDVRSETGIDAEGET